MEQTLDAEILVGLFEDDLVLEDFLYNQIKCRLSLLMPKSLDRWLKWLELLQSTRADANL